ncbi:MAG: DUF2017 domain-containing protein [Actinomycetales bacterium]|nr:DUF2017 domain-containing protein [Candidatus Phosphoribacter baldrii]
MARAFRRKGDRLVGKLDEAERLIVASLMEQTRSLLAPDVASTGDAFADLIASLESSVATPEGMPRGTDPGDRDPALARLLPDAHRGDPAVSAEFRRLTEQDLRRRKSDGLTAAIDALRGVTEGDRVSLDQPTAQAFVVALTDTRLLIGERLGLRTEEDAEALELQLRADPDNPVAYAAAVYDFLTWLQDSLVGALMGRRLFP